MSLLLSDADEPQRLLRPPTEVPRRRRDVRCTGHAQKADGEIPQRGHRVRPVATPDLGSVLVEDDVSNPVQPVLDEPVAS